MTNERARVEAWMREECPHPAFFVQSGLKRDCVDCLLAYAVAQVEQEAADVLHALWERGEIDKSLAERVMRERYPVRARREGSGGAA